MSIIEILAEMTTHAPVTPAYIVLENQLKAAFQLWDTLNFETIPANNNDIIFIAHPLTSNTSITHLNLRRSQCEASAVSALAKALEDTPNSSKRSTP